MRGFERRSGGNPWAGHGQPRRSYFPTERHHGGTGSSQGGRYKGDKGDWTVARSRKRKSTELDRRGRDKSRGSDGQRGAVIGNRQHRFQGFDSGFKDDFFDRQHEEVRVRNGDGFSNFVGGCVASAEWHATDLVMVDSRNGYKASFYVTNFPENLPLFRLRQAFEVCGILSDMYVARHRNSCGQEFGFVRFVNVKNKSKLLQALNNVWMGDCRVFAKEARFDRFAHNDIAVVKPKASVTKAERENGAAVPRKGVNVNGVIKGEPMPVQKGAVKKVTMGSVVVSVRELERKKRVKTVKEGSEAVLGFSREEGKAGKVREKVVVSGGGGKGNVRLEEKNFAGKPKSVTAPTETPAAQFTLVFKSCKKDRAWASSGMVAHIKVGDSALSFQQRIKVVGFPNVTVTPLGGDRVLLHCTGGDNFSTVLKGAYEFFGMLFSNFHKWSESLIRYERGAWLRVYGIPVHAWNDTFFRLCVSGIGRFLYVDDCIADKAHLDFAHILVVTPEIEIVNKLFVFIIDGRQFAIKLVEEWGCNLGENAFMSEGEADSTPEESPQNNNLVGLDEVQGEWELDDLVTDLQTEWCKHEKNVEVSCKNNAAPNNGVPDFGSEFFEVKLSPILQPVQTDAGSANEIMENKQPINDSLVKPCNKKGPWSIDWIKNQKTISEGDVVFYSSRKADMVVKSKSKSTTSPLAKSCKLAVNKKGGVALQSVGFMKKITRLPANDRKQIIRLLKKQKCKNKMRTTQNTSKLSEASTSNSSKNSNTTASVSGTNDWENWLHLHGKVDKVKEDVRELGKVVGVKVNCDISNSFNMLSRDGRREWRAAGGIKKLSGAEWVFRVLRESFEGFGRVAS